ncbi:hypothetical protein C8R44DRAFT_991993, partial [Mycena epipterygia]
MYLAGTVIAGFFYGIYFNLFSTSTYLIVRRSQAANASPLYKSMAFLLGCALFLSITGHCIIAVVRIFQAFIFFKGGTAPAAFFGDASRRVGQPTEVAQNAFGAMSVLLSDLMVMHRLWVISNRNKLTIADTHTCGDHSMWDTCSDRCQKRGKHCAGGKRNTTLCFQPHNEFLLHWCHLLETLGHYQGLPTCTQKALKY